MTNEKAVGIIQKVNSSDSDKTRAYNFLYENNKHWIRHYLIDKLKVDLAVVDDYLIECFGKAFKGISSYHAEFKFVTWLSTITKHHVIDKYKRKKSIHIIDTEDYMYYNNSITGECALSDLIFEEQKALIKSVLDAMPDGKNKDICVLKFIEDKTTTEINIILGIDQEKSTTRIAIHRCRKLLSNELKVKKSKKRKINKL
jgi:RNA polymerase sigma factor (sigma-70 family)